MNTQSLFQHLLARLQAQFAADPRVHAHLRDNGISDERVWAGFGIGAGGLALSTGFAAEREALTECGLCRPKGPPHLDEELFRPTFDPHDLSAPAGFIKFIFAQNKPPFATTLAGRAMTSGAIDSHCFVIADALLQGLRLAKEGVRGVVGGRPEVLPLPLGLHTHHELIGVSYKTVGLELNQKVLEELATAATTLKNNKRVRGEELWPTPGLGVLT